MGTRFIVGRASLCRTCSIFLSPYNFNMKLYTKPVTYLSCSSSLYSKIYLFSNENKSKSNKIFCLYLQKTRIQVIPDSSFLFLLLFGLHIQKKRYPLSDMINLTPFYLLYFILKFFNTILNVVKLCNKANKFDGNTFINPKNINELLIDTVLLTLLLI